MQSKKLTQSAIRSDFFKRRDSIVPDLAPGVGSLIANLSTDDLDFDDVVAELELHPVMVARLIGLANSAWSAPSIPIIDAERACIHLGLNVVKSSMIAYALSATFNYTRSKAFDPMRFWSCALLAGHAAAKLSLSEGIDHSLARSSAMLRHLGLLWLLHEEPDQTDNALKAYREGQVELSEALRAFVGIDHISATRILFESWDLPESLTSTCVEPASNRMGVIATTSAWIATAVYSEQSEFDTAQCSTFVPETILEAFASTLSQRDNIMRLAQNLVH